MPYEQRVDRLERPRVGNEAWEVEWLSHIVEDECGDMDPDRSTYSVRMFSTEAAASGSSTRTRRPTKPRCWQPDCVTTRPAP